MVLSRNNGYLLLQRWLFHQFEQMHMEESGHQRLNIPLDHASYFSFKLSPHQL